MYRTPPRPSLKSGSPGSKSELFRDYVATSKHHPFIELLLCLRFRYYDHPNPISLFADTRPITHTSDPPVHPPSPTTPSAPPGLPPPHFRSQDLRRRASGRTTRTVSVRPERCPPSKSDNGHSYATAKDEFEIAAEETEKKTVYAADDRAAAQEELTKFKEAYEKAINSADGEQIKNRIGSRVRELERAVEAMEERAMED